MTMSKSKRRIKTSLDIGLCDCRGERCFGFKHSFMVQSAMISQSHECQLTESVTLSSCSYSYSFSFSYS